MENIIERNLISYCGLYCGTCRSFKSGKCPGCAKNEKASWCKLRTCNIEHHYSSCADCKEFSDVRQCKKFNNPVAKIFAFIFNSDRPAAIELIKEKGYENFALYMAQNNLQTIKKKKK
jgi:hypothetical protein